MSAKDSIMPRIKFRPRKPGAGRAIRQGTQKEARQLKKLKDLVIEMIRRAPSSKAAVVRHLRAVGACGKQKGTWLLNDMVRDGTFIHYGRHRGAKLYLPEQLKALPSLERKAAR